MLKAGPFLRFADYKLTPQPSWFGSVLVVVAGNVLPSLHLNSSDPSIPYQQILQPVPLDRYLDFTFFRFDLAVPARPGNGPVPYVYRIDLAGQTVSTYTFYVAGVQDGWKWGFWSCNGFSKETEDTQKVKFAALWEDVMRVHTATPLMLQIGGGDQVYADPVFNAPSLQKWLKISGKENRKNAPWTQEQDEEINNFYFNLYTNHFMTPVMRDALASIPFAFQPDDHDYFDGWGSYPDHIQHSAVFQNLGRISTRFMLLFQHHSTPQLAPVDGFFGRNNACYNFVKLMGPEMAILGVDTRCERTQHMIMSPETMDMIFTRLAGLPHTVKHLIVLTGVPIVYPALHFEEGSISLVGKVKSGVNSATNVATKVLGDTGSKLFGAAFKTGLENSVTAAKRALGKEGLMSALVNKFGEMELTDDLVDHWTHDNHIDERRVFIQRLQAFSFDRRTRVTLIAGDVHVAGCGFFESAATALPPTNVPPVQIPQPHRLQDHRFMVQVVSSAIINLPPPAGALKMVLKSADRKVGKDGLDENTIEDMEVLFDVDVNGEKINSKLIGRRNWCLVTPDEGPTAVPGQIVCEIRIEIDPTGSGETKNYRVWVPPLFPLS